MTITSMALPTRWRYSSTVSPDCAARSWPRRAARRRRHAWLRRRVEGLPSGRHLEGEAGRPRRDPSPDEERDVAGRGRRRGGRRRGSVGGPAGGRAVDGAAGAAGRESAATRSAVAAHPASRARPTTSTERATAPFPRPDVPRARRGGRPLSPVDDMGQSYGIGAPAATTFAQRWGRGIARVPAAALALARRRPGLSRPSRPRRQGVCRPGRLCASAPLRGRPGVARRAMLERLDHERAEARAFAPLVLASLVAAGDFRDHWVPAVTAWYVHEQDARGHDPDLGWVHAVATAPTSTAPAAPPVSATPPPCSTPWDGVSSRRPTTCGATRRTTGWRVPSRSC